MITAEVSNYKRLNYGVIEIPEKTDENGKIVLVLGYNEEGKSSLCEGIGRAFSQHRFKNAEEAQEALTDGAASGFVRIIRNSRETNLTLPDGEITGSAVTASSIAVGLENLPELTRKEDRFLLLSKALKALPSIEDLRDEMVKAGYTEVDVDNAWKMICSPATQRIDFPKAHQEYSSMRTKLSGRWCEITGKRQYGKATEWTPEGFKREELLTAVPEDIDKDIEAAQKALLDVAGSKAIDVNYRASLESQVEGIAELEEELKACTSNGKQLRKELQKYDGVVSDAILCECWTCHTSQIIVNGESHDPALVSYDAGAASARAALQRELDSAMRTYKDINSRLDAAKQAKALLDNMEDVDTTSIDKAQQDVNRAKSKKSAYEAFTRAEAIHKEIEKIDLLKKLTAADGLPGKTLSKSIREFNKYLKMICDVASWKLVQIVEGDASVVQKGKKYSAASKSGKFRIQTAIQLAFAKYDGSELVVLDEANCLDNRDGGLPGLIHVLSEVDIPTVVNCMANSRTHAEELAAQTADGLRYGYRYWVEDGQVTQLDPQLASSAT